MPDPATPDGWLLDITESPDGRSVVLWTKDRGTGRVHRTAVEYRPPFLVTGTRSDLAGLARELAGRATVERVRSVVLRPSVFDRRPRTVLEVTPAHHARRRALARSVDELGGFVRFVLYDVDLGPPQLYHLAHDLYPFAPVVGHGSALRATEPAETVDYVPPPLVVAHLGITLDGAHRGRLPPTEGRVRSIRLGDATLEGPEEDLLRAFVGELARADPDVLLTEGGDAFDLPWLYRRAAACGLGPDAFALGREPVAFRPARAARSFETYGRILYRSATYPLPGRFHLDRENSFLFDDADLAGLIDAARLSRLSLSTVARQSPGTCFTAMEMAQALRRDAHVPWKKNRPESFRRADRLVAADRGARSSCRRSVSLDRSTSSISRVCSRTSWCGRTSPPRRSSAGAVPRARSAPRDSATDPARGASGSFPGRSSRSSRAASPTRRRSNGRTSRRRNESGSRVASRC